MYWCQKPEKTLWVVSLTNSNFRMRQWPSYEMYESFAVGKNNKKWFWELKPSTKISTVLLEQNTFLTNCYIQFGLVIDEMTKIVWHLSTNLSRTSTKEQLDMTINISSRSHFSFFFYLKSIQMIWMVETPDLSIFYVFKSSSRWSKVPPTNLTTTCKTLSILFLHKRSLICFCNRLRVNLIDACIEDGYLNEYVLIW